MSDYVIGQAMPMMPFKGSMETNTTYLSCPTDWVIKITHDGTVHLNPAFTQSEQVEAFVLACNQVKGRFRR